MYIFFISVTGSVLVYRNELYVAATPDPVVAEESGTLAGDVTPDREVGVGIWLVSTLIELHADLLGGSTGRRINGIGAIAVLVSALSGLVVWWPGIRRWRRSLVVRRGAGWKRTIWDIHGVVGFWSAAFILVFAVSGIYLSYPVSFHDFVNWLYGSEPTVSGPRLLDDVLAWIAYSHFGRINGIGLPCDGPGLCDQTTKAVWAVFGLAPAAMFVTGMIMWWNRVVRRKLRERSVRRISS